GFLITGLLLQGRDQIERGVASGTTVARNFFARRALRLFPIYFLVVALSLAALPGLRADAAWYLFYAQNILYALRDGFVYGDHLWTLAVEEQFYLVWPLVVLATPRRWLGPVVVVLILAGPAFRIACLGLGMSHFQVSMLTPAHIDTLGIGALLALLAQRFGLDDPQLRRLLVGSAVAGFTVLLGVLAAKVAGLPSWIELLGGEFGAALLFVWLIGAAAQGFTGPLGWLLSLPFLVYLGRISYGMYLYHWFLPDLLGALGIRLAGGEWPVFVQLTLLSIAIAALSWHVLEKPANGLKRHF
ncbi:acyltransferase family protein, partial [Oceanibacterium hippocampi]|uniref:acyltransferase family protein n=1 Tax=Oceanibacterium hippocampi TaxID=745714 RepID=UPI000A269BCF